MRPLALRTMDCVLWNGKKVGKKHGGVLDSRRLLGENGVNQGARFRNDEKSTVVCANMSNVGSPCVDGTHLF